MTTTLAANANGDLYLDAGGNLAVLSDLAAVQQTCEEKARTRLNELVLQTDEGVPFFESVFTGSPNVATFENALRAALVAVDGVTGVEALEISQSGSSLNYTADIATIYGPATLNG